MLVKGQGVSESLGDVKNGDTGAAADEDDGNLSALILKRAEKRKADASDFLDSLATKYCAADEQPESKRGKGSVLRPRRMMSKGKRT